MTVYEIIGGGSSSGVTFTWVLGAARVSPVWVSRSLATPKISPTVAALQGTCFLPTSWNSAPSRSLCSTRVFSTGVSEVTVPRTVRNKEICPAKGSMIVLKQSAATGASGSPSSSMSPELSVAARPGRSLADGNALASASSWSTPTLRPAEPMRTGHSVPASMPECRPDRTSSAVSSPSSRYFSTRSSSAMETDSIIASSASLTASSRSAGTSCSVGAPPSPL